MINKKSGIIAIIVACGFFCLATHAMVSVVCLKNARSGEDQKLYGYYHTTYATSDNYHCYFTFDPNDIVWITRGESKNRPQILQLPYLPSYQAKVIYFTNAAPYLNLIEALKKPGKTLKHLQQLLGLPELPIMESWQEAKAKLMQ